MKKRLSAGLLALGLPGLMFSAAAIPAATATTENAETSSEIVTEEECTWYLLNAPGTVSLGPADPTAEYEGEALDISATFTDFNVHSSGNVNAGDETTHAECTFYGDGNVVRPIVNMQIADSDFDATYADGGSDTEDSNMDFSLGDSNALDVSWASSACDAKWTQNSLGLYGGSGDATLSAILLEIGAVSGVTDPVPATADANDRCKENITIGLTIPANKKPAEPGKTYTWTGPNVVTALSTSGTDS